MAATIGHGHGAVLLICISTVRPERDGAADTATDVPRCPAIFLNCIAYLFFIKKVDTT
ncbi:hypothetical protein [Azospirillum thiophilum]|uniref:hypothetical protein n=1 Tax=Azospirillum thiophilum TaxID=528244 RepID=UPI001314FA01|nr:hypothetical protein [Azospirillum thiophilum]